MTLHVILSFIINSLNRSFNFLTIIFKCEFSYHIKLFNIFQLADDNASMKVQTNPCYVVVVCCNAHHARNKTTEMRSEDIK